MRAYVRVFGAFGAGVAALASAACASFRDGDDDPARPVDAASEIPSLDAGGADDAATSSDASTCPTGGRDAGNACGLSLCPKDQTCCLTATLVCTDVGACATQQRNCASPAECDVGKVCCQVQGTKGTRCVTSCSFGAPLCEKDADCKPGEYCREPDMSRGLDYFHCASCAGR